MNKRQLAQQESRRKKALKALDKLSTVERTSRYKVMPIFMTYFGLTDVDLSYFTLELWLTYGHGHADPERPKRSNGAHIFIRDIVEHCQVDWNNWSKKMHKELREIIEKKYPQLMVSDQTFALSI